MIRANPPMGAEEPSGGNLVRLRTRWIAGRLNRGRDEREFLPAALEIIETPASPVGRATALTIVAAALFAIAWASIGRVDIIVTAQGRIEPIGASKNIQPLQAGVVQSILVQDNQMVTAGQVLLVIDPTDAKADVARANYDRLQAQLDQWRLTALRSAIVTGGAPALSGPPANATPDQINATLAAAQSEYDGQLAKIDALDQQIGQQREKNGEALASLSELRASLTYASQLATVRDQAMRLGIGSKIDWITAHQQLAEQQQQVAVLRMQAVEATAAQDALVAQRSQAVADYETSVLGDLVKADQQIDQNQQDLSKAQNELGMTTLRAPITGSVQELAVHTVGGVVTPAQSLMVIVPANPKLTAEIRIENQDVGFVHIGQAVQLKISAFDFTRYGTIPGVITGISRDTEGAMPITTPSPAEMAPASQSNAAASNALAPAQDPRAGSYIAEISLAKDQVNTEYGPAPLDAGMELTADIKTGRRTVMSYLLSPLAHHIEDSAHER